MKPFPRDQMFGMYRGEQVMVVGVPDEISDLNALCLIEYYSPLTSLPVGTTREVQWGEVEDLTGPAVGRQP